MTERRDSIEKPALIDDVEINDTSTSKSTCTSQLLSPETLISRADDYGKETPLHAPSATDVILSSKDIKIRPASRKGTEHTNRSQKKEKKDQVRPMRPLSAYNFFFQFARAKLLNGENLNAIKQADFDKDWFAIQAESRGKRPHRRKTHGEISFREMAQVVASKWKLLDKKTRTIFELPAKLDRDRYNIELENWKRRDALNSNHLYKGFPTVTPENRKKLIDEEIAYYQATKSSQALMPSLPYRTTYPPAQHIISLPATPPVLCMPQASFSAYQLYAAPGDNIGPYLVSQIPQFTASTVAPSNPSAATPLVQPGLQPGCYYQTGPFLNVVQPNTHPCTMYTSINDTNFLHQLQVIARTPIDATSNERLVLGDNQGNSKIDMDQNIYTDDIGAFSDDDEDSFGKY